MNHIDEKFRSKFLQEMIVLLEEHRNPLVTRAKTSRELREGRRLRSMVVVTALKHSPTIRS
jgi:hypothetical protein